MFVMRYSSWPDTFMYLGFLVLCDFIFVVLLNSIRIKMFLQEEWM